MNGRRTTFLMTAGLGVLLGLGSSRAAKAQFAVGYIPNIGSINDGASLNVTPVVSADRRYVRMTLLPVFNQVNGFEVFTIPGAVAGVGGGGFGGGGGLGGGAGGGGGFVGRSVGLGKFNRNGGALSGFGESRPLSSFTAFANTPEPRQAVNRSAKAKKTTAAAKKRATTPAKK